MNAPVWISRECDACGTSFRFASNKGGKFMSECYPCASGNADPELQLIAHALYAVISQAIATNPDGTDAANVPSVLSQTIATSVPARYKRSVVSLPNPG